MGLVRQYLNEGVKINQLNNQEKKDFCQKYKDVNEKHIIFALIKDFKYIGGISINNYPNIEIYKKYNLNPEISISWFYIDSKYRNYGYGTYIFEYILKKYKKIALTTGYKTDEEAKKLYLKYNFKIINKNKNVEYWYHP